MELRLNVSLSFIFILIYKVAEGTRINDGIMIENSFASLNISTRKLISYYEIHSTEMNIDGLLGLKILQSSLNSLLGVVSFSEANYEIKLQISRCDQILSRLSESVLNVNVDDLTTKLNKLISLPWIPWAFQTTTITSSSTVEKTVLTEAQSDACFAELLTDSLSADCQFKMLSLPLTGYGLTHQILFQAVMYQRGGDNVNPEVYCSHAFTEMRSLMLNTDTSLTQRDLVLEQITVCGYFGYVDRDILFHMNEIFHWQHHSGCFGHLKKESPLLQPHRKLQKEKILKDGCSSHMTSVAAGAFATFWRIFITEYDGTPFSLVGRYLKAYIRMKNNPNAPKLLKAAAIPTLNDDWSPGIDAQSLSWISQPYFLLEYNNDNSGCNGDSIFYPYIIISLVVMMGLYLSLFRKRPFTALKFLC